MTNAEVITLTANTAWIKKGDVLCFKIVGRYFFQFIEVEFSKASTNTDFKSTLFWTLSKSVVYEKVFLLYPIDGDCAIRACCKATGRTWNEVFDALVQIAYRQKDVLSANKVWGEYLEDNGYVRYEPDYPMDVYKFCCNFPHGTYVLGLDGHVVTVVDGRYFDTWDFVLYDFMIDIIKKIV